MLDPCTVTDEAPVPAWLLRRLMLSLATSSDQLQDTLLPRSPTVKTTLLLSPAPCPTMHLTDVSDSHSVASHPVCPSRARPVYETSPMLDPCKVTDAEPDPAALIRRIMLTPAKSTDQAWVMLLPLSPAVITTRRVPRDPCPTRHLTDVSDSHSVASHPVCPSRARPVCATSPILDPCTVIDSDPVPALFWRRTALINPTSTDIPFVTLDPRPPDVRAMRRVPPALCPSRHLIDVSDPHSVASHPVCPSRARPVYDTSPILAPCTVTDADPVPALFL